jgi:hypothetical protein
LKYHAFSSFWNGWAFVMCIQKLQILFVMHIASAKSFCCLVLVAAIINSTLSLQMSAHISRGFNSQPAWRILGYQCANPNCLKLFANAFANDQHRNHATRQGTLCASITMRESAARRGYRIAPVGYIHCGTFDTPKHWLDTEPINSTSNRPFSTITATRTLTGKVFWIRLKNTKIRKN